MLLTLDYALAQNGRKIFRTNHTLNSIVYYDTN